MATERLSMRVLREILRQRWVLEQSHRAVARSTGRSVGAVHEALRRAREAGLDWAQAQTLTDAALEAAVYRRPAAAGPHRARPQRSPTASTCTPSGGRPASRSSSCTSSTSSASTLTRIDPPLLR